MFELINPKQNEFVLLKAETETLEIKNSVLYLNCFNIDFLLGMYNFKLKFLTAKINPINPETIKPKELKSGTII